MNAGQRERRQPGGGWKAAAGAKSGGEGVAGGKLPAGRQQCRQEMRVGPVGRRALLRRNGAPHLDPAQCCDYHPVGRGGEDGRAGGLERLPPGRPGHRPEAGGEVTGADPDTEGRRGAAQGQVDEEAAAVPPAEGLPVRPEDRHARRRRRERRPRHRQVDRDGPVRAVAIAGGEGLGRIRDRQAQAAAFGLRLHRPAPAPDVDPDCAGHELPQRTLHAHRPATHRLDQCAAGQIGDPVRRQREGPHGDRKGRHRSILSLRSVYWPRHPER